MAFGVPQSQRRQIYREYKALPCDGDEGLGLRHGAQRQAAKCLSSGILLSSFPRAQPGPGSPSALSKVAAPWVTHTATSWSQSHEAE